MGGLIMKTITLNYYQDPGHGWAKISLDKLKALGIDQDISYFSYTRGSYAYLEEDCDLSTLYRACDKQGIKLVLREYHSNKNSKIRNYQSYYYHNPELIKELELIRNKVREENQTLNLWNT
jgi:hypothetical protein